MYIATLDGQQLGDDVDVSIDGWPRVDYLSRSVSTGRASLSWQVSQWVRIDYRGQPVIIRRDHDNAIIMRGLVSGQSVNVGFESSTINLTVESGEVRVKKTWPTDYLEDDGRFPLDVSGIVQRVFGRVESVPLPEVRVGFRLIARNPIYGKPDSAGVIDVYEGDDLVAANRPIQRIEDGLGDVYSVIEVDPGLDGKTLRSGPVVGNLPGRASTDTVKLRGMVEYIDDIIGGGWSLAARVLPEEIAKLPVGMLITDAFTDVAADMLDRLGGQYGFTVDVAGGWSIGPNLMGITRRVPGTLNSRTFIDQGIISNVRVEWGTKNGDPVGAYQMPDDHDHVVAIAGRNLPIHQVRAVDVPSEDIAGVVARRMMVLNGRHRERWVVEVPLGHEIDVGDAIDLDEIERVEVNDLRGLVETIRRGAASDEIEVLV